LGPNIGSQPIGWETLVSKIDYDQNIEDILMKKITFNLKKII